VHDHTASLLFGWLRLGVCHNRKLVFQRAQ
jgi:hypothetical protein